MAQRDENPYPTPQGEMPVADRKLIAEFIAQSHVTVHTRHRYATQIGEFAAWLAHERTQRKSTGGLLGASRADVTRFIAYLSSGDRYAAPPTVKDHTRVLTDSARKNFVSALKSFFDYFLTVEEIATNPTDGVRRPRVVVRPGLHLKVSEVRRFLDAPGLPRDRAVAYLLAYTACRLNEIRCLRWRDVDMQNGTIVVHGKGDKYRVLDLHPRLVPELRRWRQYQDMKFERDPRIREARSHPDTDFVLLSRNGRQLCASAIAKHVKRRAVKAGLHVKTPGHKEHRSAVSPHVLRRTFGTTLLNAGHHLDAVADVLGHECVDTTRKHYAFSSNERRRATIEGYDV